MADAPGIEEWTTHASSFDRVRAVALTLAQPRTADRIAAQAAVAETTARSHLERLVGMNVLEVVSAEGVTHYQPNPHYTRMQSLRELLDGRDRDELIELRTTLQSQVETWANEYGVDSPDGLRALAATAETADRTRDLRQTAKDWELVRYRLEVVADAIEHYDEYSGSAST